MTVDIAMLSEAASEAATVLEGMIPSNVNINHPRWPDDTVLPCDVTLGDFRRVAAVAANLRALLLKDNSDANG